jgi:hypothetical protein
MKSYEFWWRNLWQWVVDLVRDPLLASHFEWDACLLKQRLAVNSYSPLALCTELTT